MHPFVTAETAESFMLLKTASDFICEPYARTVTAWQLVVRLMELYEAYSPSPLL